ncbi:MAG: hypothetical protein HOH13_08360, partial [Crocinitomicaceae bacterium]|nr:hypothetical protein [Crocinitomicaceae bacterium]
MKNYIIILPFLFGLTQLHGLAQIDTSHTIFSKMDISPQHTLWDGNQTMLMGYTQLMGAAIDIPGPTLVY